jgi:hypothetical protein
MPVQPIGSDASNTQSLSKSVGTETDTAKQMLEQVRLSAKTITAESQQPSPARPANASAIAIHGVARGRVSLPVPSSAVWLSKHLKLCDHIPPWGDDHPLQAL